MKKYIKAGGHIKHFLRKNGKDNISAIAAQSAFFIILSFVPFLLFAVALLSYFKIPTKYVDFNFLSSFPGDVSQYISRIIQESYNAAVGMAFTSAVLALWSSGKGIYSVSQGIFVIYRRRDRKNWFFKRLEATVYTVIMFVVLILSLVVLVISQFFEEFIVSFLDKLPHSVDVVYGLRYIIMFFLLVVLIALALKLLLFRQLKDKKYTRLKNMLPGAAFTALSWTLLSVGISLYVNWFGGFSLYGSLGTAAVVMIWLYFAMYLFLCGIQFNYIYRVKIYNFNVRKLFKRKK